MGWIIALIIGIWLLYLLFVHIIIPIVLPITGLIAIISLIGALIYGFIKSIQGFGKSFIDNLNPYATYIDKNRAAPSGVKRNYFFGPGFYQLKVTIKGAFNTIVSYLEDLRGKRDDFTVSYAYRWHERIRNAFIWVLYIVTVVCLFVFGFAWTAIFSIVLVSIVSVGFISFFIFFSMLWLIDRAFLWGKSIQSRCGGCKNHTVVPNFICPGCGMDHTKLTPGFYGVIYRKCPCGIKLPTTIFTGRSKLSAKCPFCATDLAAGSARQFGIQIVGGVSAGKTTFLAAFWHEYINMLNLNGQTNYFKHPLEAFSQLEEWFSQGLSSATTETNANMYSIVHNFSTHSSLQLTLYDIAGESFTDIGYEIMQKQFRYCEGFIFIIDPLGNANAAYDVISNFIHTFREVTGKHSSSISKIPAAVVIAKADLFKKEIGLPKILNTHKNNLNNNVYMENETGFNYTRNYICWQFLVKYDFTLVINLLNGEFTNIQYYPVSAIGREAVYGAAYEPWGVLEPIKWILQNADAEYRGKVRI